MLKRVRTTVVAILVTFAAATFLLVAGTSSALAAKPCKSQASALADAQSSCEAILGCSKKTPPQEISCRGRTNRWICKCVKPKGSTDGRFDAFLLMEPEVRSELMSLPVQG